MMIRGFPACVSEELQWVVMIRGFDAKAMSLITPWQLEEMEHMGFR
jgi:hypothetical protein